MTSTRRATASNNSRTTIHASGRISETRIPRSNAPSPTQQAPHARRDGDEAPGKTFTLVNQIYRLMKAGVAKRVLFLVDRRALAAQAVRAFAAFDAEPGHKFDRGLRSLQFSFSAGRFRRRRTSSIPRLMPESYLTDPQLGHAFVYVCTIQRMAINILGRQAIFGLGDEAIDDDAAPLRRSRSTPSTWLSPTNAHRGYTSQEVSVWRATLDHLDADQDRPRRATPASPRPSA